MDAANLFHSVAPEGRLVDRVVDQIQRLILDGHLRVGTRLPSEMELAAQLGVSRTVIREAVRILTAKGLLETRPGVGSIVRQMTRDQVVEPLGHLLRAHNVTLDDLHEVRGILEVEIAGLAARQADAEDIAKLRQAMEAMTRATNDAEALAAHDAEFHRALAQATHNPLLVILLDSIRDLMQEVRLRVSSYPDIVEVIIPDHYRVLDCVVAGDEEGARRAMREHIDHAREFQRAVFMREADDPEMSGDLES
ncbi:MAG: FadR/GntR family transcriptional regulator [Anaerolineae bacterium]